MDTNASSPKSSARLAAALSIGAVICASVAGAASAQTSQPAGQPTTQTVSVADLDLRSADGARAFLKRLDIAAQRACGVQPVRSPLLPREPAQFEQCVRDAVATAVKGANQPMVAALHAETLPAATTLASR